MLLSIKALYKFTNAFSLTPLFDFENCVGICDSCYKMYSLFVTVAISGSYIYHARYFYPLCTLWETSNFVISATMSILLHAFNLLLVINQVARKRTKWTIMLQRIYEMKFENMDGNPYCCIITVIHAFLGMLIVYELINWYKFYPNTRFFAFMLVNVQEVVLFVMISLVSYLALLIKQRFKLLCETITSFDANMEFIIKSFLKLIEIVECFNQIFGLSLFIYFGLLLLGFLDCVNIVLNRQITSLTVLDAVIVTAFRLVSLAFS